MSERERELIQAINENVFPAINVLRGIEIDVQDHPCCPYRQLSRKSLDKLMNLLEVANGKVPLGV